MCPVWFKQTLGFWKIWKVYHINNLDLPNSSVNRRSWINSSLKCNWYGAFRGVRKQVFILINDIPGNEADRRAVSGCVWTLRISFRPVTKPKHSTKTVSYWLILPPSSSYTYLVSLNAFLDLRFSVCDHWVSTTLIYYDLYFL